MLIYALQVTKDGAVIFEHDIPIIKEVSFADAVRDALAVFYKNFPDVSLAPIEGDSGPLYDMRFRRKPEPAPVGQVTN